MNLTDEQIKKFQEIYLMKFGETLSAEEVYEKAVPLLLITKLGAIEAQKETIK